MMRAVDSAIGLPSRSTSASRMLAFLMPAEVRRILMLPLLLPFPMRGCSGDAGPNRLRGRLPVPVECSTPVLGGAIPYLQVGPARRGGEVTAIRADDLHCSLAFMTDAGRIDFCNCL